MVLTILVCGYSAWSLWDGFVAYPRANVQSAVYNKIGTVDPKELPSSDPELTADRASEVHPGEPFDSVVSRFGQPALRHGDTVYYFGYGGFLAVELAGNRVANRQWTPGPQHRPVDLAIQKVIGMILAPVGLACLIQLLLVVTTRATLTDTGLKVRGNPLIPFEAITEVRPLPDGKSGCFDLFYSLAGRSKVLRLDDYVLKQTSAIVQEICRRRSFPSPLETTKNRSERIDTGR